MQAPDGCEVGTMEPAQPSLIYSILGPTHKASPQPSTHKGVTTLRGAAAADVFGRAGPVLTMPSEGYD